MQTKFRFLSNSLCNCLRPDRISQCNDIPYYLELSLPPQGSKWPPIARLLAYIQGFVLESEWLGSCLVSTKHLYCYYPQYVWMAIFSMYYGSGFHDVTKVRYLVFDNIIHLLHQNSTQTSFVPQSIYSSYNLSFMHPAHLFFAFA